MIATKGKRKICFQGRVFYWWIKKEKDCNPRIHIISDDKKMYLKKAFDKGKNKEKKYTLRIYIENILSEIIYCKGCKI